MPKAVAFNLQTRLAIHEVLPLDFESEGTIMVGDQILIRPRR